MRRGVLAVAVVVALAALTLLQRAQAFEVDDVVLVTRVVDGDTFDCRSLITGASYRVRLADVNAPELYTAEGKAAKGFLASLIQGRRVYLDIDDLYHTDKYGRVVAVAYLRANETHLVNVNLLLVRKGYAEVVDYRNEFNPRLWSLYVYYPAGEELQAKTITVTVTETVTVTRSVTAYATVTRTVEVGAERTVTVTETLRETVTQPPKTTTVTRTVTETVTATARAACSIAATPIIVLVVLAFAAGAAVGYALARR